MKNASAMRLVLHFNIDRTVVMRDSLVYNNTDYLIREILASNIWGRIEYNKLNEAIFKVVHSELEQDKSNVSDDPEVINYKTFIEWKYPLNEEKENNTGVTEEERQKINEEILQKRTKLICDIVEPGHPGNSGKLRKQFEDLRKRLRCEEKIQIDYGLKLDNGRLDEKNLWQKEEVGFAELEEDKSEEDKKIKFRRIFKNSYFKIILSFFDMMIALKKAKKEFALVFRFFGHSDDDKEEFIYEFNSFCEGNHPRFNGEFGTKPKFDGSKGTKDYRISYEEVNNCAVAYRHSDVEKEKFAFNTLEVPEQEDFEAFRDDPAEIYEAKEIPAKICTGFNEIYLNFMEKLSQHSSFAICDDYAYYKKNSDKSGKLFLVDPYDYDTLQIFFDWNLENNREKIDVVDVVNCNKLKYEYCLDKFLVNVDPRKAIEKSYFLDKIALCETNRLNELKLFGAQEFPVIPISQDLNIAKEIRKISSDKYLEMTIFPLLSSALNLVDIFRPEEPIPFIANFMLNNKKSMKNLEDYIKDLPKNLSELNENKDGRIKSLIPEDEAEDEGEEI